MLLLFFVGCGVPFGLYNWQMIRKTFHYFTALVAGLSDHAAQQALLNLQKSLEYCMEENRVLREQLQQNTGRVRVVLTDSQRRRLGVRGFAIGRHILSSVTTLFQPETILGWHRKLVAQKYDGSARRRASGRPRVAQEIVDAVLRLARRNPSWGYDRLRNMLAYLGMNLGRTTVKRILDDHGIVPAPEHKQRVQWGEFLRSHADVIAATDFFSVELLTPRGLVRCMVLFVIDIATRRVDIAGIKADPDGAWMLQIARNLTDGETGFLRGKRFLVHDRDPLFTKAFCDTLAATGVETIRTPPATPNMNAYAERFVQTIKHECLNKMILTSQLQLEYVIGEFMEHYHRERPHMGLGGRLIDPWPQDLDGEITEFQRLGGLLRGYRRVKTTNRLDSVRRAA